MKRQFFRLAIRTAAVLVLLLLAVSCRSVVVSPSTVTPSSLPLTPTVPPPPAPTASPLPATETAPPLPTPTPPPLTHTVARGEDMGRIALQYGVEVAALMAANPQVNPHMMSVGTALIIPAKIASGSPAAGPTPLPLNAGEVSCSNTADGGAVCFLLVTNNQPTAVENLGAVFELTGENGGGAVSRTALAPLNLLPAGASLPLVAQFPPPLPHPYRVNARLSAALPLPAGDTRYLAASIENLQTRLGVGSRSAEASGEVLLAENQPAANQVWVAAVALGSGGQVLGVRRWEGAGSLAAGGRMPFRVNVYSAGGSIDRVTVMVEARP